MTRLNVSLLKPVCVCAMTPRIMNGTVANIFPSDRFPGSKTTINRIFKKQTYEVIYFLK